MKIINCNSEAEVKSAIKQAKNQWIQIEYQFCHFKVFGNWAQLMISPSGLKSSGNYNKTQSALLKEIIAFATVYGLSIA